MSLIEEALRRIEESGASRAAQAPAAPVAGAPQPATLPLPALAVPPAEATRAPSPIVAPTADASAVLGPWVGLSIVLGAGVFLLIVGLGIAVLWNAKLTRATPPLRVRQAAVAEPARVAPVAITLPPTESVTAPGAAAKPWARGPVKPDLELNGVVQGVGEPFAILNGRIVRLGETIDGAMLVEVGEDFARLQWRQEEILLRSSR